LDTSVTRRLLPRRYTALPCAALLALTACSGGESPGQPVRSTIAMPTAASPGRQYAMPSACLLATSHSRSLLLGRKLQVRSQESGDKRAYCQASTALRGDDRSATSTTVTAWPTAALATNSITSTIKSGDCKPISGIVDSACMKADSGLVNLYVARGNIYVVSTFRLIGLVRNNSEIPEYARHYAESVSRSIR
jgi:hypothetical protein